MDYDTILEAIGDCGPWQIWLFGLLCVPSCLSAMAVFMYEFTAYVPKHRCLVPECDSSDSHYQETFLNWSLPFTNGHPSSCQKFDASDTVNPGNNCTSDHFSTQKIGCDAWVWDDRILSSSATIDLDMVCQYEWRRSVAQTLYMAGMAIGSIALGWLSDRVGRKSALMISSIFLVIGGSIPAMISLDPELYYVFAISRFISGMGHAGTFMLSFTLALEYVGPKYRVLFGILIETPFASGGLLVGLVSYLGVRRWETLSLVLSLPNLFVLAYWWLLPESPRWLIKKDKLEQLQQDVNKAAKWNKTTAPNLANINLKEETCSATFLDLLRPRQILIRSLVMFFNWMVTNMCYYGLTSIAATLLDDIYLNYTLVILVEIPAHFLTIYLLSRWGRRPLLGVCQLTAGITCIVAGFLNQDSLNLLQVALALIGKFGATGSFAIVFVYTAELFPTEIRSTAVGTSATFARIGGVLAPQIASLVTVWRPLPLLILGGWSAIGGALVFLFLPETLGKKLPESMDEALLLEDKQPVQKAAVNGTNGL